MVNEERYHADNLAAGSYDFNSSQACAGFICVSSTSGTITVTANAASGAVTKIAAFPVTAGQVYKFSTYVGTHGFKVTLTNCTGTLLHF